MKKYTKMINVPLREDMMKRIKEICEEKDIPVSVFIRDAIKLILEEKEEKYGISSKNWIMVENIDSTNSCNTIKENIKFEYNKTKGAKDGKY